MIVIRGETVQETAILSPTGELLTADGEATDTLLEQECRTSFQKGVSKGEQLGYEKALEELNVHVHLLQTLARHVLEQKARLLDQLKPEVVGFAIAVCERVIRQELADPERFSKLILVLLRSALPTYTEDRVEITLSPEDFKRIKETIRREISGVHLLADPMMASGNCRVETAAGLLHFDLERELADLKEKVLQR